MLTIEVEDKKTGEVKTYRVKDFDELTLADWRALTYPEPPEADIEKAFEHTIELLHRHTGITAEELRRLNPANADKLVDAIRETIRLAMEAKAGAENVDPPKEVEHEGVIYAVPQDLEQDTCGGQWWDFQAAHRLECEADIMIRSLCILLVPKGQEYDGDPSSRQGAMERFPMSLAFHVSAFFFDKSERYRQHMSRSFSRLLTWIWHRSEQGHVLSQSATKR